MRTTLLALAFAFGAAAVAQAATPIWIVEKGASRLGFTGAMNGSAFKGAFSRWDAQIAFDPANLPASAVTVSVDPASAASGDPSRDEALPTGDWFSVKAFPRAVFKSRRITAAGPGRYVAEGDLTLRNVTKPVSLPFTLAITGDMAKMTGSTTIDRSVFGVGQGQWKTGDAVALKVSIDVAVTAKRAK